MLRRLLHNETLHCTGTARLLHCRRFLILICIHTGVVRRLHDGCTSHSVLLQLRLRNDDLARRTTVARQTAAASKQRILEKQERLQQACGSSGPLAACLRQAKEQRLCYPDLLHTWRHTHGLLVTRRHQLVISLFHHFRLQPQVGFMLMLSASQQRLLGLSMHGSFHASIFPTLRKVAI